MYRYLLFLVLLLGCTPGQAGCGEYAVGDSFPAPDGCNTCFCGEKGMVACTEMACAEPVEVTPEEPSCAETVQECCDERHKDDFRVMCVGSWEYDVVEDQCIWECTVG